MKTKIARGIVGIVVLMVAAAAQAANLVSNPGFESGLTGWGVTDASKITATTAVFHGGSLSARLSALNSDNCWKFIQQGIPVMAGCTYDLKAWMKIQNAASGHIKVVCGSETYFLMYGGQGTGTWDWTQITGTFTVPADASTLYFQCWVWGSNDADANPGYVWLDDVSVTPTTNMVANWGFENNFVNWNVPGPDNIAVDSAVFHGGTKSAKVIARDSEASWKFITQTIPVHEGTFNVSLWMKIQNANSAHAKVIVGNESYFLMYGGQGTGTWDWTQFTGNVTVPAGVTAIKLQCWIWGGADGINPGYMWVDDLRIDDPLKAELDRGHYLLLVRGLQIQALCMVTLKDTGQEMGLNLYQFLTSNFTTPNLDWFNSKTSYLGDAPGIPWGKVADTLLTDADTAYACNLVSLSYSDEQDMTVQANLDAAVNWFGSVRYYYPNAVHYTNQGDIQLEPAELTNYIEYCHPDMISLDCYPFHGNIGDDSPDMYYDILQKYRLAGLAGLDGTGAYPIPYAQYNQTWVYQNHTPTEPEIRLNHFSSWVFGYTFLNAFFYTEPWSTASDNYQQAILFNGPGDSSPTSKLSELAATNAMSKNIGPALVRLISTDVRFIPGRHYVHRTWFERVILGLPTYADNSYPQTVSGWSSGADPYITSISAANVTGEWNNGYKGDVLVGLFKPLHEDLDGSTYSNQRYFMIVNGLMSQVGTATAYACRQNITVDFNFGSSGITGLQRMRRSDGVVENIVAGGSYTGLTFTSLGNNRYRMVLTLDGGTGDLFKYNTGASFVGTAGQP